MIRDHLVPPSSEDCPIFFGPWREVVLGFRPTKIGLRGALFMSDRQVQEVQVPLFSRQRGRIILIFTGRARQQKIVFGMIAAHCRKYYVLLANELGSQAQGRALLLIRLVFRILFFNGDTQSQSLVNFDGSVLANKNAEAEQFYCVIFNEYMIARFWFSQLIACRGAWTMPAERSVVVESVV